MFSSVLECTNFIFSLKASTFKGKPLEAVQIILHELGNPHHETKYIHVAGSNGKGSTVNAVREILMKHGFRVGAFVSPHMERVNERITINKQQISDEAFLNYTNQIFEVIQTKLHGSNPSFFEIMTVIALLYFAEQHVDVALIETGIGGRVDSTNVIIPEVSVITTISLEHTDILGDTIEKIAYEKAGIIKTGKPVILGVKQKDALDVIKQKALECNSPIFCLNDNIEIINVKTGASQQFDYVSEFRVIEKILLAMKGYHQIENAALAITAALTFDSTISTETICSALKLARWEGRFEQISKQIIIDGAHNSEGTLALIQTLKEVYPTKNYKFIYAALSDKDHEKSIQLMDQVASKMSFTEIQLPRAAAAIDLAKQSTHQSMNYNENWRELIEQEKSELEEQDLLVITGSLYFISEVRKYLLEKDEKNDSKIK